MDQLPALPRSRRQSWGRTIASVCLNLVFIAGLAACQAEPTPPAPTPTVKASPPATPVPSPSVSPAPTVSPTASKRTLVACLGEEPTSLYLYGPTSTAEWNILEAVYDGPVAVRGYTPQPVILQKVPNLKDGDAVVAPVSVQAGDEVIDADGNLVTLAKGTLARPAGCTSADCAAPWDGKSDLKMDQMTVTFKLLPGLKWSDGVALKASDSIYSYKLAADPATPTSKFNVDRTVSYQALDDQTLRWVGKPGYLDASALSSIWLPLPEHLLGKTSAKDLLQAPEAIEKPVGWGPYVIDEWVKGDHLTLHKNPYYFRVKEGLPRFDTLVYRFITAGPQASLTALLAGECDVVDTSSMLDQQLTSVMELAQNKKIKAFFGSGLEWEHVDFNIRPAAYDTKTPAGSRPDFFGDVRTRQALADCMDRQGIVDQILKGESQVLDSYILPQNPLYNKAVTHYGYDVTQGSRLLDAVGWKDDDNDPSTARVAHGIKGVPDGTPFIVSYFTTQADLRRQVADALVKSLGSCGIKLQVQTFAPGDLFAEGPAGAIFGRKFDLVAFSWESSAQPPCFLYETSRIPNDANQWVGVNITGYSNPDFDAACSLALQSLPGQIGYTDGQAKAQAIFATDLPVIPLYAFVKVIAARPDMCDLSVDPSARSDFWALATYDYSAGCQK